MQSEFSTTGRMTFRTDGGVVISYTDKRWVDSDGVEYGTGSMPKDKSGRPLSGRLCFRGSEGDEASFHLRTYTLQDVSGLRNRTSVARHVMGDIPSRRISRWGE